jgi:hypothetical protein
MVQAELITALGPIQRRLEWALPIIALTDGACVVYQFRKHAINVVRILGAVVDAREDEATEALCLAHRVPRLVLFGLSLYVHSITFPWLQCSVGARSSTPSGATFYLPLVTCKLLNPLISALYLFRVIENWPP